MTTSVDVHLAGPADCRTCCFGTPGGLPRIGFGCLEHTCPDCGSITHAETNAAGELTHRCPTPTP